jgi:hypothetical protein
VAWRVLCSVGYASVQALEIYRRRDLERTVAAIRKSKGHPAGERDLQDGTAGFGPEPLDLWAAKALVDYRTELNAELLRRFPGHAVYRYRYPGSLQPGADEATADQFRCRVAAE